MKAFLKDRLNLLTYGSVAALLFFFVVFSATHGGFGAGLSSGSTRFYVETMGRSLAYIAVVAIDFAAIFLAFLAIVSNLKNFIGLFKGRRYVPTMLGGTSLKATCRNGAKTLWRAIVVVAPAIVLMIVMSLVLDGMNVVDKARLLDVRILGLEQSFLGGYGFTVFGSVHYPTWLARFIVWSFESMSGLLLVAAFIVAYVREEILRELVASFCFCMILMVPAWFLFPALSPQDRFVDNIYHLPETAMIAAAVSQYHPVAPIADFLTSVRAEKSGLADLPTSTLPSAHAAWAVLVGYYLFRARRWLGWIALPILIASTAGTVILAQHYVFDVPVGILIAAFAIFLVSTVAKKETENVIG